MKIQKAISVLLAGLMLFGLAGCNKNQEESSGGATQNTQPVGTVGDYNNDYVEGTLHKVNVTPSDRVFTANKRSDYKVVIGTAGSGIAKAAEFIVGHVELATGAEITYAEEGAAWADSAKYIVIGDAAMYAQAGLTVPTDNIGPVGYYIKTAGNSVFLMAKNAEGYQMAAIAFLREVLGYDMISADTVVYEKDGKTLPNMDIVERPDFDTRAVSNIMTEGAKYGMGYSADRGMITVGGNFVHNTFNCLPPETYLEAHPDWYTSVLQIANGKEYRQLCYTAHGNAEEYEAMLNAAVIPMMEAIKADPEKSIISFTHEDVNAYCRCDSCLAVVEEYGAPSAFLIMFCNDLEEKLDAELTKLAEETGTEKRQMKICFFAYHWSEKPPLIDKGNGEYELINGLKCNDNVAVFVASIENKYYYSFNHEINRAYADNLRGWTTLTDTIYSWLYQTNFGEYMYPYNTWSTQIENYRFVKSMGSEYMFCQGQHNQKTVSHFTRLKEYIDSKALFDVNVDYNELVDRYFKYYFREAAAPMRQFFNELQSHCLWLEETYGTVLTGYIRDSIAQSKYWPQRTLQQWLELIDEAYAAIEKYQTVNPSLYDSLKEHILVESIFPRFAICDLHSGTLSAETLKQMRYDFYMDATSLTISHVREADEINGVYKTWGVI